MDLPKLNPLGLNLNAYKGMSISMLKTLLPNIKVIEHGSDNHFITKPSNETIHVTIGNNTNQYIDKVLGFYE